MKNLWMTYRGINGFLLLMAIVAMSFAWFFLQKHLGFHPCPLCIFQRIGVVIMGVFTLIAVIANPSKTWARLTLWLGSVAGIGWSTAVAARHVWLQHLPADEVPSCGPGLDYWVDTLPMFAVVKEVFKGSGECASIDWQFLGLSIPEQSLIVFGFLLLIHVYLLVKIIKH